MPETSVELITPDVLLERVRALKQDGWRLVQIGATRRPDEVELTYSFDLNSHLANLRLVLPGLEPKAPSISSVFWCAFLYENEIHDLFKVAIEGIAVDFQGNLYQTRVKFPFGTTKPPVAPKTALVEGPLNSGTREVVPTARVVNPVTSPGRLPKEAVTGVAPVSV
jgi:ech hydrogenase subunit D